MCQESWHQNDLGARVLREPTGCLEADEVRLPNTETDRKGTVSLEVRRGLQPGLPPPGSEGPGAGLAAIREQCNFSWEKYPLALQTGSPGRGTRAEERTQTRKTFQILPGL